MKRPSITGLAQVAVLAAAGIDLHQVLPAGPWPVLVAIPDDSGTPTWHASHRCESTSGKNQRMTTVTFDQVRAATVPGLLDQWWDATVWLCPTCGSALGADTGTTTLDVLAEHTGVLWLLSELLTLSGTGHLTNQNAEQDTGTPADADTSPREDVPNVPDYDGGRALHPDVTWDHLATARLLVADLADAGLPDEADLLHQDPTGLRRPDWPTHARALLAQILDAVTDRSARLAARLDAWAQAMAQRDLDDVATNAGFDPALPVTAEQITAVAEEEMALTEVATALSTLARSQSAAVPAWLKGVLAPHWAAWTERFGEARWARTLLPPARTRLRVLAGLTGEGEHGPAIAEDTVQVLTLLRQLRADLTGFRLLDVALNERKLPGPENVAVSEMVHLAVHRIVSVRTRPGRPTPMWGGDRQSMLVVVPATAAATMLVSTSIQVSVVDLGPVEPGDTEATFALAADLWWSEHSTGGWSEGAAQMTALARLVDTAPTLAAGATT